MLKHYNKDCKPWMDPTPKRNMIFESQSGQRAPNLVKEPQIPPRRKFWVGEQESKRSKSWSSNCSPPPQQQQLSQFQDLTASPQVKRERKKVKKPRGLLLRFPLRRAYIQVCLSHVGWVGKGLFHTLDNGPEVTSVRLGGKKLQQE